MVSQLPQMLASTFFFFKLLLQTYSILKEILKVLLILAFEAVSSAASQNCTFPDFKACDGEKFFLLYLVTGQS